MDEQWLERLSLQLADGETPDPGSLDDEYSGAAQQLLRLSALRDRFRNHAAELTAADLRRPQKACRTDAQAGSDGGFSNACGALDPLSVRDVASVPPGSDLK